MGQGQRRGDLTSFDQAIERMRGNHRVTLAELEAANEELKKASRAVHESERRLRLIAEHVDDQFILRNRDSSRITYVSPSFDKIFGQTKTLFEDAGLPDLPCDASTLLCGTVLLVEDDPTIRATTCHQLEALGLDVLEAADGAAALLCCQAEALTLDLLISDVTLPDMNGPQLVAMLQQPCPVLLITANPELVDEPQGFERSFPLLRKPFTMNELARRVVDLLRRTA